MKKNIAVTLVSISLLFGRGGGELLHAQNIGINTTGTAANASSLLDVVSATKGVFVPRVVLSATNNTSPITPAPGVGEAGLIVYNTATAGVSPNDVTPGYYYWDGTIWVRWSGGSGGLDWSILGNAGTVDGTNFIGSTDDVPFNIRVNNYSSGRIDGTLANTFFGFLAGGSNTTGSANTAIGMFALSSNVIGMQNTATGLNALGINTGDDNTGTGVSALQDNNTGNQNTAMGISALAGNVAGSNGTAIGANAMFYANSTAVPFTNSNVAVGFEALRGSTAAATNTGNSNTSLGYQTLRGNTSGGNNTALGYLAGYTSTAANANTTGSNNTFIGYNTGFASVTQRTNATAIGYNAKVDASSTLVLGGTGADAVNVGIGTTVPGSTLAVHSANIAVITSGVGGNLAVNTTNAQGVDLGAWLSLGGYYDATQITPFAAMFGRKENGTSGQYPGYLALATSKQGTGLVEAMRITSTGNAGIGTTAPGASAQLELGDGTDNKGFLLPRVSLLSTTDVVTVASPATSLIVYNTNASMTNGSVGFWFWDSAKWVKYLTGSNSTTVNSHCYTCDGF